MNEASCLVAGLLCLAIGYLVGYGHGDIKARGEAYRDGWSDCERENEEEMSDLFSRN